MIIRPETWSLNNQESLFKLLTKIKDQRILRNDIEVFFFSLSLCMCVCVCVQAVTLEVWHRNIFGMMLHLDHISVKFKCQGSMSRSYFENCLFGYLDITLKWFYTSKVKVINQVKIISRSRSFQCQIVD